MLSNIVFSLPKGNMPLHKKKNKNQAFNENEELQTHSVSDCLSNAL